MKELLEAYLEHKKFLESNGLTTFDMDDDPSPDELAQWATSNLAARLDLIKKYVIENIHLSVQLERAA